MRSTLGRCVGGFWQQGHRRLRPGASHPRLGWIGLVVLGCAALFVESRSLALGDGSTGKRVENRGTPAETSARAAGAIPDRTPETPSAVGSHRKCETHPSTCPSSETTSTEETKGVEVQETVVVEVQPVVIEAPRYAAFAEIVLNTLGLPRAAAVTACLDPRYPLPSYALVGIQPWFASAADGDVAGLQRFDCELEADAGWRPQDFVYTLIVGQSRLEVTLAGKGHAETVLARDSANGRWYPLAVGLTRSAGSALGTRYVLSFSFIQAESGLAPRVRSGESICVSIDLSDAASPGSAVPRCILVRRTADPHSTLVLVEKSGSTAAVLPSLNELELAAHCSVVHRIRQ